MKTIGRTFYLFWSRTHSNAAYFFAYSCGYVEPPDIPKRESTGLEFSTWLRLLPSLSHAELYSLPVPSSVISVLDELGTRIYCIQDGISILRPTGISQAQLNSLYLDTLITNLASLEVESRRKGMVASLQHQLTSCVLSLMRCTKTMTNLLAKPQQFEYPVKTGQVLSSSILFTKSQQ